MPHADALNLTGSPGAGRSLTAELEVLLEHAAGQPITIGNAMQVLRSRGAAMVMLLATLPCVIPGVSAALAPVVGSAIAVYGLQLAVQHKTLVPRFLQRRTLSYATLQRLVHFAVKWGRPVEHLLRPRLMPMSAWPMNIVTGLAIAFCGFFMALPLFIPLSNEIPAVFILVLLLGVIERDGIFLLAGLALSLVLVGVSVYLCVLFGRYGIKGGAHVIHAAMHHKVPATAAASQRSQ